MSAIGSGVLLLCGNQLDGFVGTVPPASPPSGVANAMTPLAVAFGGTVTVSHYVRRKAWQVLVSDDNGNVLPMSQAPAPGSFSVSQTLSGSSAPDTIVISCGQTANVFIAVRWQENSVEAQLFPISVLNDGQDTPRTNTTSQGTVTVAVFTPGNL